MMAAKAGYRLINVVRNTPPSEPFTDEILEELKLLVDNETPITEETCDAVLSKLNPSLRDNLNLTALLPYLTEHQLLDVTSHLELTHPELPIANKCDRVVAILRKCPKDNLKLLVRGLIATRHSGVGDSHDELLCEIYRLYKTKAEKDEETDGVSKEVKIGHMLCAVGVIAILFVLSFCVLIIVFGALPFSVKLILQQVPGNTLITLNDYIKPSVTSSVKVMWNDSDCFGDVLVLPGHHCLETDLFIQTVERGLDISSLPFYALPPSHISILVPRADEVKDFKIIITKSPKDYTDTVYQDCYVLHHAPCNPDRCYRINEHLDSNITFNITNAGYYSVLLISNDPSYCIAPRLHFGFQYHLKITSFNSNAVINFLSQHSIEPVEINDKNPTTFEVYKLFKPNQQACYLLNFTCKSNTFFPTLSMSGAMPRGDIMTAFGIFSLIFFLVGVVIFLWIRKIKCTV